MLRLQEKNLDFMTYFGRVIFQTVSLLINRNSDNSIRCGWFPTALYGSKHKKSGCLGRILWIT